MIFLLDVSSQNKADKSASNSLNPSIFEGLVTLCAPDAVCFSRHIPHASGRILAERFYVIGTLRSNFLLHKKQNCRPTRYSSVFFISVQVLPAIYLSCLQLIYIACKLLILPVIYLT